jgi:integrase
MKPTKPDPAKKQENGETNITQRPDGTWVGRVVVELLNGKRRVKTVTGETLQDVVDQLSASKKRGSGEGSIHQRPDGLWVGRISLGSANGKRKVKAVYAKTQGEVIAQLTKLKREQQLGLPVAADRQKVAEYLTRWLNESARHTIRQGTFDSYSTLVRLHVVPYIGDRLLVRLSGQDISGLYNSLLAKGLSARTVQYVGAVLHRAMKQAMRWDLIARNPCELVDVPRKEHKEIAPIDVGGIMRLLDSAKEGRFYAIFVLAIVAGLREGELLGLPWADIDWQASAVTVRRQLVRDSKGLRLTEVKTAKGRRTVTLPQVAIQALRAHRAQQNAERLALGEIWTDNDLVFPTEIGTPFERQNFIRQTFKPLLKKAGMADMRFHDLRHYLEQRTMPSQRPSGR